MVMDMCASSGDDRRVALYGIVIWCVNANCNLPISSWLEKGEDLEATIRSA
ncbi:hypothetical protein ACLK2F_17615 [Escherichia coli]